MAAAKEDQSQESSLYLLPPISDGDPLTFPTTSDEEEETAKLYYNSESSEAGLETIASALGIPLGGPLQVITISGGTEKQEFLKKELEDCLIDELSGVLQYDKLSLVITSGADRGVIRALGKALKSIPWLERKRLHCLGIMQADLKTYFGFRKTDENVSFKVNTKKKSIQNEDVLLPNRHHTHHYFEQLNEKDDFVLNGGVIRRQLEHLISTTASVVKGWSIVLLSVNGGPLTIKEVANALSDANPIPVVLFQGTGGATDFIVNEIRKDTDKSSTKQQGREGNDETHRTSATKLSEKDKNGKNDNLPITRPAEKDICEGDNGTRTTQSMEDDNIAGNISSVTSLQENLKKFISNYMNCDEAKTDEYINKTEEHIKTIIKAKAMVKIFVPHGTTKTNEKNRVKEHENLVDILTKATELKTKGCNRKQQDTDKFLLIHALRNQKINYISKKLNGECKISEYLDKDTVSNELYDKDNNGGSDWQFPVDDQLKKAINKYYDPTYNPEQSREKDKDHDTMRSQGLQAEAWAEPCKPENKKSINNHPYCDVFLWAITTSRFNLAESIWSHLEYPIIASLVVSCALNSVAQKLPQRKQKKKDEYVELARKYEEKATDLIGMAHLWDPQETGEVLRKRHKPWRSYNSLEVAIRGKAKPFLSKECCHYQLRKMWFGEINIEERHWKILIFSPFYWLVGPWIPLNFNSEDQSGNTKDVSKTQTESQKSDKRKYSGTTHIKNCLAFYRAPVAKYGTYVATFMIFLLLYTYLMVFGQLDNTFSALDITLHVWIVTIYIETIREMFHLYRSGPNFSRWKHFAEWRSNMLNMASFVNILFFITAFTCRWFAITSQAARFFYGVNYSLLTMRILRLYTANKTLGPLVAMIKLMFLRTVQFSAIFIVFLSAYAVAVQTIVGGHAGEKLTFYAILDVFYEPYFQTFGEFFLDDLPGADEETEGNAPRTATSTMYIIFLAFYVFVGHLLMMNLLIAIFNRDIEDVHAQSKEIWTFDHYVLHELFSNRPVLPEPLSLFVYFIYLVRYIIRKCTKLGDSDHEGNKNDDFMRKIMSRYISQQKQMKHDSSEGHRSRMERISDDILGQNRKINRATSKIRRRTTFIRDRIEVESGLNERVKGFEERINRFEMEVMKKFEELFTVLTTSKQFDEKRTKTPDP